MKTKNIILLLGILVLCASVEAQNLIRIVEDESRTRTLSLNGNAEAVFVAGSDDLFIETSRPSLDRQKNVRKASSGKWEYVFDIKLHTQEGAVLGRTFSITQTGSANKTTFKKGKFEPNKRYYFIVETVKNPIFLVDNTQATDVHLVNNEALIELNCLSQIDVIVDQNLDCMITPTRTNAGYYSTQILVDMKSLDEMRSNVEREQMLFDDLNGSLLERAERGENVKDSEWYNLQVKQQHKEELESMLEDVTIIRIKAEDSNELVIDISDMQAKQKRVYTVEMKQIDEPLKLKTLLIANYGLPNTMQHSFGITMGWVKRFGFYASVMSNGSFTIFTDLSGSMDNQDDFFWSDKTSSSRLSATLGCLFALKKFGYAYVGAGYGIRNLVWYTESGQSVAMTPGTYQGVAAETGLIVNIGKHFEVSVGGYTQFPMDFYEVKAGLGFRF